MCVSPKHQRPVLPDSKLGVLYSSAVLHRFSIAHHVPQTVVLVHVKEASVLRIQALPQIGRLRHVHDPAALAAPGASRLQHRHGPQGVGDKRHVAAHPPGGLPSLSILGDVRHKHPGLSNGGRAVVVGRPGLMGGVAMDDRLAVSHMPVGVGRAMAGPRRVG